MKIQIQITKEIDLREVINNVLCNGLCYFPDYGVDLNYSQLTEMILSGKTLRFIDTEGDMNEDLTLQKVQDGFKLYGVNPTFTNAVDTLIEENDDSETCDVILQCLLYGDVVFG